MALLRYIQASLGQQSTRVGLAILLPMLGAKLAPEQTDAILSAVLSVVGAVLVAWPEKRKGAKK